MPNLAGLSVPLRFRGSQIEVTLDGPQVHVRALPDSFSPSAKVGVGEEVAEIKPGESHTFQTPS